MAKILIVDDSAFTRNLLRRVYESGGHEVVGHAGNAKQALTLFKTLHPELVTLDYLMPDKNGEDVLEEMIEHDPNARVIMISGSGDNTVEERALQTGAKVYLEKHRAQREILEVIDQVMEA
jgi:two-component system chemotaxis response regulator CheY